MTDENRHFLLAEELFEIVRQCVETPTPLLWRHDFVENRYLLLHVYQGVTERVSSGPHDGTEMYLGFRLCVTGLMKVFSKIRPTHIDFDCRASAEPYVPYVEVQGTFKKQHCVIYLYADVPFEDNLPVTSVMYDDERVELLDKDKWRPATKTTDAPEEPRGDSGN